MICKKCGCDAMIKTDDWYKCPSCGWVAFDTDVKINNVTSPTKEIEKLDNSPESGSAPADTGGNKAVSKDGKDNKNGKPEKSKARETIEFFIPIVCAVVIALILKTFVFANAVVPTGSMLNTIQQGDRIIASRLSYINNDPERYDIVIFEYPDWKIDPTCPDDEPTYYVKRIIGLPGETVEIVDGVVYVTKTDGEKIQLETDFITNCVPSGSYGPYTVPEDCYFMMGDNRNDSWDSRFWTNKFVHRDTIIGKVKFRYYPSVSKIE